MEGLEREAVKTLLEQITVTQPGRRIAERIRPNRMPTQQ
jgi:hypothetical protein